MNRSKDLSRRNGFAMVLAVALIGLVAVAISALVAVMRVEFRESIAATTDVQIRQMLIAAEPFAEALVNGSDPQRVVVPLPDALKQNNGSLTLDLQLVGAAIEVTVHADYGEFSRTDVLQFAKENDRWVLKGTTLAPLHRRRG